LETLGVLADPERAPLSVGEVLSRAVLAGERVDVIPEVLYRLPKSAVDPLRGFARAQDPVELLRPYYLGLPPEARDIAVLAARIYSEEPALRPAAVEADHLADLYAQLVTGRGMRVIRALRSPGQALRRLLGRRRG